MEPSAQLHRIAHDLNNLLGAILNYSTLLSRQVTDPVALADIEQIRSAAEHAASLTLGLLHVEADHEKDPAPVEGPGQEVLDA